MLSNPQQKHSIDFSRTRKHPFVSAFDGPGNDALGYFELKTGLSLGVTILTILFIAD